MLLFYLCFLGLLHCLHLFWCWLGHFNWSLSFSTASPVASRSSFRACSSEGSAITLSISLSIPARESSAAVLDNAVFRAASPAARAETG